MRRLFLLSAFLLLLSACGGSDGDGAVACEEDYWDGTYGTCLPKDWSVLDGETLHLRGVPESTVAAFQSEVAVSGQFPSVAITRESLASVVDPLAYSEANIRSVAVLPGYNEVDVRDIVVDGTSVRLHIFTAQPVPEEPSRRYYQVSTVESDLGYTVTATTPVSVQDSLEQQVMLMLQKSTFMEPKE